MKVKFLLSTILASGLTAAIYGQGISKTVESFDKPIAEKTQIPIGEVKKSPPAGAFIPEHGGKRKFMLISGKNDILDIDLNQDTASIFAKSFTLSFDVMFVRSPNDIFQNDTGAYQIDFFKAYGSDNKPVLDIFANRYNRLTVCVLDKKGKPTTIASTWSRLNYLLGSIFKGKWYEFTLTYDEKTKMMTMFLDGELIISNKISDGLPAIKKISIGNNLENTDVRCLFYGGIDNLLLSPEVLHNKETSEKRTAENKEELRKKAKEELSELLYPEDPAWAERHPCMVLTPARLEVLKAELKKGSGPELMRRLVEYCDSLCDPESPKYKAGPRGSHHVATEMIPALLCLCSQLTGEEKYARHAAELLLKFTDSYFWYYDMIRILVYSAGAGKPVTSVALAYDWGYDYFTPEQRRKLRLFLLQMSKGTYDLYTGGGPAMQAKSDAMSGWAANWTALSIATLGNSSLAILGETAAPVNKYLEYAEFRAAQYGIFACGEGAFHEMPNYLAYAAPVIIFMDALYTAGGPELLKNTDILKIPEFLAYASLPYRKGVMALKYSQVFVSIFGNDNYLYALINKRADDRASQWYWNKFYGEEAWLKSPSLLPMIWFKPDNKEYDSPGLPLGKWFRSEGIAAFRSGWDKDALAGVFMAYCAKIMAHDQADRGQFTLCGYGSRWIVDSGGRNKPEHAFRSAHNLITIDGKEPWTPKNCGHNYPLDSFMSGVCNLDSCATAASADLTPSYRYTYNWGRNKITADRKTYIPTGGFKNARRDLVFMREENAPPYLLVYDEIQQDDSEHEYTLNLQAGPRNEVTVKGSEVSMRRYPSEAQDTVSYVTRPVNPDGSHAYYYSGSREAGFAEYEVDIPEDGEYILYGLATCGEESPGGMDSFFIDFGDKKREAWGTGCGTPGKFEWTSVASYKLKKGREKLTVLLREPESKVAEFVLAKKDVIPLFDNPEQEGVIKIDVSKPSQIKAPFKVASMPYEKKSSPEAFMKLEQFLPGTEFRKDMLDGFNNALPHYRLKCSEKAVTGRFLNFFYPYKDGMDKPRTEKVSENVFRVQWADCCDTILVNYGKGLKAENIESDATMLIVRKSGDELLSFVMVNGTFLKVNGASVLKLEGGPGLACFADDTLSVNGKNVYNFTFNFPGGGSFWNIFFGSPELSAEIRGEKVKLLKDDKGWQAEEPFYCERTINW